MTVKTRAQLATQINVIRNETAAGANTKTRIADALQDSLDSASVLDVATFANENYAFTAGINTALQTAALTAARTVTLPLANTLRAGDSVLIADLSNSASALYYLAITAAGSDTIMGGTVLYLSLPGDCVRLYTDGTSKWTTQAVMPQVRAASATTIYLNLPGTLLLSTIDVAFITNRTYYSPPVKVTTPVAVSKLVYQVTVAGGAGSTCRYGLFLCDRDMQPGKLVYESDELAIDTVAVVTSSISLPLRPGIYLPALRLSDSTSLKVLRGGLDACGIGTSIGGAPFFLYHTAVESYGAYPSTGTPWTAATAGASPGAIYPVLWEYS